MSATDEQHGQLDTGYPHTLRPELHKALMAHGIDYWVMQGITFWNRDDGCECLAYGYQVDGVPKLAIKVVGFTDTEQAIEATLGPLTERAAKDSEKDSGGHGTCRAEETDTWECICDQIGRYGKRVTIHVMECSACGRTFEHVNGVYEYCPHCRRRLVIE